MTAILPSFFNCIRMNSDNLLEIKKPLLFGKIYSKLNISRHNLSQRITISRCRTTNMMSRDLLKNIYKETYYKLLLNIYTDTKINCSLNIKL